MSRPICLRALRIPARQHPASFHTSNLGRQRFSQQFTRGIPALYREQPPTKRPQLLRTTSNLTHIRSYTYYQRYRASFRIAKKDIWRRHPIGFPLGVLFAAGSTLVLAYILYDYFFRVNPRYQRYPPAVADALRKAIYYSDINPQPAVSLQWYKRALVIADQLDMHPFSDEVLGIRLQIPAMLEEAGLVKAAIEILERTQADCEEWVANGRRRKMIWDREITAAGASGQPIAPVLRAKAPSRHGRVEAKDDEKAEEQRQQEEQAREEMEEQLRDKAMKKAAGIGIKLAELYSSDYVHDAAKAERALIGSVDCCVSELRRRRKMNLRVSSREGDSFMNLTEVATAYTELADLYSRKGKNNLATTLYMQALDLIKEEEGSSTTCKQVVLLNNIASQMAEQAQVPQRASLSAAPNDHRLDEHRPPLSQEQILAAAAQWAQKSLEVAAHINPSVRNEECDIACQIATYNLGEIAEMQNLCSTAKEYYEEACRLATRLGFEEGIVKTEEALKRLKDIRS